MKPIAIINLITITAILVGMFGAVVSPADAAPLFSETRYGSAIQASTNFNSTSNALGANNSGFSECTEEGSGGSCSITIDFGEESTTNGTFQVLYNCDSLSGNGGDTCNFNYEFLDDSLVSIETGSLASLSGGTGTRTYNTGFAFRYFRLYHSGIEGWCDTGGVNCWKFGVDAVSFNADWPSTATPSPTATPNGGATATPFPQGQAACVQLAATATPTQWATPLPFGATPTPRATATRTPGPGTPTPTPNLTATPTPTATTVPTSTGGIVFDSGTIAFDNSLLPWRANYRGPQSFLNDSRWLGTAGPDGLNGVGYVAYYTETSHTTKTVGALTPGTVFDNPALVYQFQGDGYEARNLLVTVKAKGDVYGGTNSYFRVWYLGRNAGETYSGFAVWYRASTGLVGVSSEWRDLYAVIPLPAGRRIGGVAISAHLSPAVIDFDTAGGVMVDSLRVVLSTGTTGALEDFNSVLPTCEGSTGPRPSGIITGVQMKVCIVNRIIIDVYSACTTPDSIDPWGWIVWLYCRINAYFSWNSDNSRQLRDLVERQTANEPFGSIAEIDDVFDTVYVWVQSLNATPSTNATFPLAVYLQNLFSQGFNFSFDFERLRNPSPHSDFMTTCPQAIAGIGGNSGVEIGACFAIASLRVTPVIGILQWMLNAACVVGFLMYIQKLVKSLALAQ